MEDSKFVCEVRNHPDLKKWFRQPELISVPEQDNFIRNSTHDSYYGFIVMNEEPIGMASLSHVNQMHKTAEFSIGILPEFQKKGYTKEAMRILIEDIGFKQLGLRKIYSDVFFGNPALEFFKNLGFVEEGVLKQHYWKDGRWVDSAIIARFA